MTCSVLSDFALQSKFNTFNPTIRLLSRRNSISQVFTNNNFKWFSFLLLVSMIFARQKSQRKIWSSPEFI